MGASVWSWWLSSASAPRCRGFRAPWASLRRAGSVVAPCLLVACGGLERHAQSQVDMPGTRSGSPSTPATADRAETRSRAPQPRSVLPSAGSSRLSGLRLHLRPPVRPHSMLGPWLANSRREFRRASPNLRICNGVRPAYRSYVCRAAGSGPSKRRLSVGKSVPRSSCAHRRHPSAAVSVFGPVPRELGNRQGDLDVRRSFGCVPR